MVFMSPLLDAGITLSTESKPLEYSSSGSDTALTAGAITLGTKFLDRNKNSAEEKKLSAEEKKLLAEADKAKNRKDSLETKSGESYTQKQSLNTRIEETI